MRSPCFAALLVFLASLQPASSHFLAVRLPPDATDAPTVPRADPGTIQPDLVIDLLGWIAASTNYDTSSEPPEITFSQIGDTIPYDSGTAVISDTLHGAYDPLNSRIILVRPWDVADPRDLSVLLHELVHHVQLTNRSYECPQAPEWEAYKLQAAYLTENGIASEFDWLQIYFLSKCPRDIHPDIVHQND